MSSGSWSHTLSQVSSNIPLLTLNAILRKAIRAPQLRHLGSWECHKWWCLSHFLPVSMFLCWVFTYVQEIFKSPVTVWKPKGDTDQRNSLWCSSWPLSGKIKTRVQLVGVSYGHRHAEVVQQLWTCGVLIWEWAEYTSSSAFALLRLFARHVCLQAVSRLVIEQCVVLVHSLVTGIYGEALI